MTIKEFARKQKLRIKILHGEAVIPCKGSAGRDYSHLYEHGSGKLGAMFFGTPKAWGNARRQCLAAGCKLWQNGDQEGSIVFDPTDQSQVAAVRKWFKPKKRRQPSEKQLAVLERARAKATLRGSAQDSVGTPLQEGAGGVETFERRAGYLSVRESVTPTERGGKQL